MKSLPRKKKRSLSAFCTGLFTPLNSPSQPLLATHFHQLINSSTDFTFNSSARTRWSPSQPDSLRHHIMTSQRVLPTQIKNRLPVSTESRKTSTPVPYTLQPWPQQFKYMTFWRDSTAFFRLSSQHPITPERSDPMVPDSGRRHMDSAPPEEQNLLLIWNDLIPDFHLCPWSVWPWTTATLAAIQTLVR